MRWSTAVYALYNKLCWGWGHINNHCEKRPFISQCQFCKAGTVQSCMVHHGNVIMSSGSPLLDFAQSIWMQIEPYIARKILAHTNQEQWQAHAHCVVLKMHSDSKWSKHTTAADVNCRIRSLIPATNREFWLHVWWESVAYFKCLHFYAIEVGLITFNLYFSSI